METQFNMRISDTLLERIRKESDALKMSSGDFVTVCVLKYLEDMAKKVEK